MLTKFFSDINVRRYSNLFLTTFMALASIGFIINRLLIQNSRPIITDRYRIDSLQAVVNNLQSDVKSIKVRSAVNDTLINFLNTPHILSNASIQFKMTQIDRLLAADLQRITALTQAFNPTKPEEVITIARLKDAVYDLTSHQKEYEERVSSQQTNFEESIKREVSAASNTTYWIIFILAPIVLQLLYNFWKDNRKPRKAESA